MYAVNVIIEKYGKFSHLHKKKMRNFYKISIEKPTQGMLHYSQGKEGTVQ